MKAKALTLVIVACFVWGILIAAGFSATGKKSSANGKRIRDVSEDVYSSDRAQAVASPGKYSTAGLKDESDCYYIIPDMEVPYPPTEHDLVGLTWYDFQQYGSMGRMISVSSEATGGYRHVSWMWTAGVFPGTQRRVYARTKPLAGVWSTAQEVGLGTVNSGYSNQSHLNDGTSVIVFHRSGIGGDWCYLAVADGPLANPFYTRKWDLPDYISGASEPGRWPKMGIVYDVAEDRDYMHIAVTESSRFSYWHWKYPHTPAEQKAYGYVRCYVDPADFINLICQSYVDGATQTYSIPANTPGGGPSSPIAAFDIGYTISPIVVTSPVSQRVAIVYTKPLYLDGFEERNDVCYIECMDNGDGWIDGTDWPPTKHKITNYPYPGDEFAYMDVAACYDYSDSLHIIWNTTRFPANYYEYWYSPQTNLYHWSNANGISRIAGAPCDETGPGRYNRNIAKMSISAKDPIYHPGGDSVYLFCIWTGVDSSDQNAAGDYGNHDLYGSGSFDGGNTWGKVLNLTGTKTPGCLAGDCLSEHWPSMATNMLNGDLHIEYICDRDAGGAIMDEGQWTEDYVFYMRLPEWEVEPRPEGEYRIEDPPHWYHPPIKVLPNQNRTIRFRLFSIGNEDLMYAVYSDHPCIQVSIPPTQLAIKDSIEISVLLDGTGACNGTFIAGNVFLYTDEAGGTEHMLRVHAVVADEYYECPRDPETVDTLENDYIRLYVNANCQQWIHDIGWNVPLDTTHQVFFQGGTIVATTSNIDTLVGRYMGDNDMRAGAQDKLYKEQCHPDTAGVPWEPDFWILYTKDIYIEASHLEPPNHFKWFWWEIAKQIKFFKDTAPEHYQRIVIKYVKVKRQDPPGWWPDLTPFTNYEETYIGFAMDLDAPYDSSGGPEPGLGDESACNYAGYDATNEIAYVRGFGRVGEHPEYENYHAGIALAEVNAAVQTTPYATANIKNNQYLYPTSPWGWVDGELYRLASTPGNYIQDPNAIVDRSVVLTAHKIDAGTDSHARAEFTIVEVLAPDGEAQMQALVDTARAIVARERALGGLPARCGDVQGDSVVNVGDIVYLVSYCYKNGPAPYCPTARGDVNNDGMITLGDVVYLVSFCYKGGPEPNCPGIWYWR